MNVLVVIFGGADYELLKEYKCANLLQVQHGKVIVDRLFNNRDVATQITSQLITGEDWTKSGVLGRKKFTNPKIEKFEKHFMTKLPLEKVWRPIREAFYLGFYPFHCAAREYIKEDLKCETLFDKIPNSKAVYVPSYNPEPSFAIGRNILNPKKYPGLGEEAAEDLLEKNFMWRKLKFERALEGQYQLLMCQFQELDSLQHLWVRSERNDKWEKIRKGYAEMDAYAAEIKKRVQGKYEMILFISDNGIFKKRPTITGLTHLNRPFYSINRHYDINDTNMLAFYHHILDWIAA